jgi:hypothetical protein
MKILMLVSGGLLVAMTLLWVPPTSEAAPGCDSQDEEKWEELKAKLPTSDYINIGIIIDDLTKLKDKCDPKTRFSASVVRVLIQANFRQAELGGAQEYVRKYNEHSRRLLQR